MAGGGEKGGQDVGFHKRGVVEEESRSVRLEENLTSLECGRSKM